ncbi:hypothetical protein PHLGIDRAFT_177937 [Phlebiopsis gigantea 11061_1 CR5-6]|uniref:Uncharacterized protein n=1 Tax=Phlebiopsis gigantea (strain 11061_1 CR5-6) TaxID=745531 RepID=A0A0C3S4A7_PHLG1|nr:hypothetical protein PHLGIDRAFT_177937 [Phlebiopsis gigantea 11061_1 CR5-6]
MSWGAAGCRTEIAPRVVFPCARGGCRPPRSSSPPTPAPTPLAATAVGAGSGAARTRLSRTGPGLLAFVSTLAGSVPARCLSEHGRGNRLLDPS